jgi:hypothetical protein
MAVMRDLAARVGCLEVVTRANLDALLRIEKLLHTMARTRSLIPQVPRYHEHEPPEGEVK